MTLNIKFVGALRHISGVGQFEVECAKTWKLNDLICYIIEKMPLLERSLLDKEFEDPQPTAIILVNGREISVLNGLATSLKDGDEVVFVPVVHGG